MSVVTGLGLGLLIVILGALVMTIFAAYLASRERPRRAREAPVGLTHQDAQQLIALIEAFRQSGKTSSDDVRPGHERQFRT